MGLQVGTCGDLCFPSPRGVGLFERQESGVGRRRRRELYRDSIEGH